MPAWWPTAAAARLPATPTNPEGPTADASSRTRSDAAAAASETGRGHLDGVHVGPAQPAHQAVALAEGVDHQHVEVAPSHQGLPALLGPPQHAHGGVGGQGVGQLVGGGVLVDLVGGPPRLAHRVAGRQHPGAQPPQRSPTRDGGRRCAGTPSPSRRGRARRRSTHPRSPSPAGRGRRRRPGRRTADARSGAFRDATAALLPCPAVATDPPGDLLLSSLQGEARTVEQWLTMFHLATVIVDPYTNESAWLSPTAARLLRHFNGAAARSASPSPPRRRRPRLPRPAGRGVPHLRRPRADPGQGGRRRAPPRLRLHPRRRHHPGGRRGMAAPGLAHRHQPVGHHHVVEHAAGARPGRPLPFRGHPGPAVGLAV